MDTWKCDECNMKFDSRLLYDTHKRKFCGMLGGPPAPGSSRIPQRGYGKTMVHTGRRGKSISPKELVLSLGEKSPQNFHYHPTRISTAGSSVHDVSQRMSALEQEKVEELKAFKASMSLQRAYQHSKINSGPGRKVPDSRQSRSSPNYQLDRTLFDDQLKQLEDNHQEQLDQLRAHNERLKEEKLAIQEKMNSLGLKSRHKLVSQGSVDKQEAEFEGLRKYLDYKSQEMRNEYQAEMDKLKDLKKKIHGRYSLSPETPLSTKRSSPAEQPRDTLKLYNTGAQNHNPLNVQQASPIPLPQYAALQGSGLLGEINAMEISYLQGGGRDPEVLSQIKQLELEAKSLQPVSTAVPDPSLQQQIMAYHLANQKLEQELQLLRVKKS
ncbi:uncharacterized protein LOC116289708 [Actinia tenebrosa]|uniref:Uncharacterized protein LOC116289708 n=1 Tax=Actinia tenebrosa TaxID=6105 RepID=A0A6P8HBK8_ACTTE|nr:uncharacterized protein LOC116289708 [Actinia tenebrosa]